MHMLLLTRGHRWHLDKFIEVTSNQFVPWGKEAAFQLQFRPFQLWDIIFPQEHLENVWRTVQTNQQLPEWMNKTIRVPLGYKKIPKIDPKGLSFPTYKQNIATYPIGIKTDAKWPKGKKVPDSTTGELYDIGGEEQL